MEPGDEPNLDWFNHVKRSRKTSFWYFPSIFEFPSLASSSSSLGVCASIQRGALASRLLPDPKNRCKYNLAKAVWKATLAQDEKRREFRQIGLCSTRLISDFHNFSFTQIPPFPPLFAPLIFSLLHINPNSKCPAII